MSVTPAVRGDSTVLKPLKLQKGDKWESDSDSDESDDENDLQDLMV